MKLPGINRIKYGLERWFIRGVPFQILAVAALIGLISLIGGVLVSFADPSFKNLAEATWWAFLRLSDPGYLGDDQGVLRRVVSTTLTVLGYVVFLGALVAIMTQWLNATMRKLESGVTPISTKNHLVILGWTSRSSTIIRELLQSKGPVRHFLASLGARRFHIALLCETVTSQLRQELRDQVGPSWKESKITLRSGSALKTEHLDRVAFSSAAVLIVPAPDLPGRLEVADTHTIKTLMSLRAHSQVGSIDALPLVVAEVIEGHRTNVARRAYRGPIEVLSTDETLGRLIAQNLRHERLSLVYHEILSNDFGTELYIQSFSELEGARFRDLVPRFSSSVLLGVVRPKGTSFESHLNPSDGFKVARGDRLVFLAEDHNAIALSPSGVDEVIERKVTQSPRPLPRPQQRILLLGFSYKTAAVLSQLDTYEGERFEVNVVSTRAIPKRKKALARCGFSGKRVKLDHTVADFTSPVELRRLNIAKYTNILLMGSDTLSSRGESDARTILGYLSITELLQDVPLRPGVLFELLDPSNKSLLPQHTEDEAIVSPLIMSHMLAQVALKRELRAVFDELFSAGGAEFEFRKAAAYFEGQNEASFLDIQRAAVGWGETALGIYSECGLDLAPPATKRFVLRPGLEVLCLST